MIKTIINTFLGAAIGAGCAICLFIAGFFIELLNIGWAILSCDCDKSQIFEWSGDKMFVLLCIFIIGGAIIGFFYGTYKAKEERDAEAARKAAENLEEARKKRIEWAGEVKKKAMHVNVMCAKNKASKKPLVSSTYKSSLQMNEIINELTKVAEKQGKVNSLANELLFKEGGNLS